MIPYDLSKQGIGYLHYGLYYYLYFYPESRSSNQYQYVSLVPLTLVNQEGGSTN